jgi:hypothetical protein
MKFNVGVILVKFIELAATDLVQGFQHDISLYFDSQDIYLWIEYREDPG